MLTRTIDDILLNFRSYLVTNNSPLTDFSTGSINYTLFRSLAALQLDQDVLLNQLDSNQSFAQAASSILDAKGKDFGIYRKLATYSTGYILVKNLSNFEIYNGAVLTNLTNSNQYIVTSTSSVFNKYGEYVYQIRAALPGSNYNIKAGAKLYLIERPDVTITIGQTRLDSNVVVGDIENGTNQETDSAFLSRIYNLLLNSKFSTTDYIKNLVLSQPNVSFVSISNPFPGYINIWITSTTTITNIFLDNLKSIVSKEIPIGVNFNILVASTIPIDISLNISTTPLDKDVVINKLKQDIFNWFSSLNINDSFDPQALLSYINSLNLSYLPEITYTNNSNLNIVPALNDSIITPGNISFTFSTN